MNKEEIDILYSFANDEDCRYVYDWQGFNYEEICPLIDKLIKENKKYKEVITNLSKEIDMWNSKYNDMFDENRGLKEILANNGIVSTCENCETFGVCPHSYREYDYKCELDKVTIQQNEFIEWLENMLENDIFSVVRVKDVLSKYKEIIGGDK